MSAVIPLRHLVELFSILLVLGTAITLPLFKFNYQKFIRSNLFIKILFWVPIFLIFLAVLYINNTARVTLLTALLLAAFLEFIRVARKSNDKAPLIIYFILFVFGLSHFYLLGSKYQTEFVNLLITLCFATVLSDVVAFFFGNYLGKHKLPTWLNNRKSWEGVAGQLVGALLGILLVNAFIVPVATLWLFLPLGIGSAMGDLANSFTKRKAAIKDWSNAIPGHGGLVDRLSSMAGSIVLLFYFLQISGVLK